MKTLNLTLNLPDDLAQKAQHAGLLTPQAIEAMLREQLRKLAGGIVRSMWARCPDEELTPEIEQEIVADVRAARVELRKKAANGNGWCLTPTSWRPACCGADCLV